MAWKDTKRLLSEQPFFRSFPLSNKQVSAEIEKLNTFINSSPNELTLTIERKIPKLFSIFAWMLILPLLLPILFLILYPVTTYSFNLETDSLAIAETILFSTEEKIYSLNQLKIISKNEDKYPSIILAIDDETEYTLKDIAGEKELPKIQKLIKPFTT